MPIGTSDGESFKDEMTWLLGQHNDLSQGPAVPGNIDLNARPSVQGTSPEGSTHSTVRSMSFEEDGQQVLIPTVHPEGRIMSNEDAIKYYRETGQHLGKFNTIDEATAYSQKLHEDQAKQYPPPTEGEIGDRSIPLPRPRPMTKEDAQQFMAPRDPLAPLFDPFLKTESDVPNGSGFIKRPDPNIKMKPDISTDIEKGFKFDPYTGEPYGDRARKLPPLRNQKDYHKIGTGLEREIMADDEVGSGKVIRPQFGGSSGGTAPQGPAKVISKGDLEHQRILKENEQSLQRSMKRFDEASKPQQFSTDEVIKLYKDNPKALKQALRERGIDTDKEIIQLDKSGNFKGTRPKEGSQINDPYLDAQLEQSWNKLVKEQGKSPLFQEGSPYSKLTTEQQDSWFKHIKDPDIRKKLGIPTVREVPK